MGSRLDWSGVERVIPNNTVDCGANKYTKTEITVTRINFFRGVTHNEVEKVQMEMVILGERSGQG